MEGLVESQAAKIDSRMEGLKDNLPLSDSTVHLLRHIFSTQTHNQRYADSPRLQTGNNKPKIRITTASPLQFCLLPTAWTRARKCRYGPYQGCPGAQYAKHRQRSRPFYGILAPETGMGKRRQKTHTPSKTI